MIVFIFLAAMSDLAVAKNCIFDAVPYRIGINHDSSIAFGCRRPSCFGYDNQENPAIWSKFYKHVVKNNTDGGFHIDVHICSHKNPDDSCYSDMPFEIDFSCCMTDPIDYANYYGYGILKPGQEMSEQPIKSEKLLYISDVASFYDVDAQEYHYQVNFSTIFCPKFISNAPPTVQPRITTVYPLNNTTSVPSYTTPSTSSFFSAFQQSHYYPLSPQGCSAGPSNGRSKRQAFCPQFLCFSADTEVLSIDGEYKRMDGLTEDDYILSSDMRYSKVKNCIHKNPNTIATFRKLTLEDGTFLKITENHLIYKSDCQNPNSIYKKITNDPILAKNLYAGDCLFMMDKSERGFMEARIISIETVIDKGIYAPLTYSGDIVVNNIAASCFSNINHPYQQTIFRQLIQNFEYVYNWSKSIFKNTIDDEEDLVQNLAKYTILLRDIVSL